MKNIVISLLFLCLMNINAYSQNNSKLLDSLGLSFVEIPKGKFIMGSIYHAIEADSIHEKWFRDEAPVHRVTITDSFELSSFEIKRGQFEIFVNSTGYITDAEKVEIVDASLSYYDYIHKDKLGSLGIYDDINGIWMVDSTLNWRNPGYKAKTNEPINHVSWKDTRAFCNWLNSIDATYYYELPTEAEWEYAANCAGKNIYSWGNELPNKNNGGNIADKSFFNAFPNWKYPIHKEYNDKYPLLAPVGSFQPNDLGLYDMTGNVWEWVDDYYSLYSTEPKINPNNIGLYNNEGVGSHEKVIRGGGFDWELSYLRTTKRRKIPVDFRHISEHLTLPYISGINIGFRVKRVKRASFKEKDMIRGFIQPYLNKLHFNKELKVPIKFDYKSNDIISLEFKKVIHVPNSQYYFVYIDGLVSLDGYPFGFLFLIEMPDNEFGTIGYCLIKEDFGLELNLELAENYAVRVIGTTNNTGLFDITYNPIEYKNRIIYK